MKSASAVDDGIAALDLDVLTLAALAAHDILFTKEAGYDIACTATINEYRCRRPNVKEIRARRKIREKKKIETIDEL